MQFPPPPGLAFLAYMSGSISREEYLELVRMCEEEHETYDNDCSDMIIALTKDILDKEDAKND